MRKSQFIPLLLLLVQPLFSFGHLAYESPHDAPRPKTFKLPFHLVNKLIVIEAKVNQKTGWFILDTGMPDLVLNKKYFQGKETSFYYTEIHGNAVAAKKMTIDFQMGRAKEKTQDAIVMDLRHLERKTKISILGMIGLKNLKKYELLLDYRNKTITFFQLKWNGKKMDPSHLSEYTPSDTIAFKWKGHLPTIPIKWGGQSFRFGLDTGAGINLVARNNAKLLISPTARLLKVKLINLKSPQKSSQRKIINAVKIGNRHIFSMNAIAYDFEAINASLAGKKLDGILGYEFLKQQKVAINYRKRKLYLWSNPMIEKEVRVQNIEKEVSDE